jgi:PAS domain S-box-containing protein
MVGIGAGSFILIGGIHAPLVDAGIVETPYMVSFAFLTMVLAVSYELVANAVRSSRYAREIESRDKRWDALVSNVQLSIIGVNSQGRIDYINPFFECVSGYSADQLVGQPATRIVPASDVAKLIRRLDIAAETEPRAKSQWTILCRSGERRQFLCSTVRRVSAQGLYEGVITVAEDITARLRMQHELATARREMERLMRANMLGELVSGLAHELNQPLTAVLSNAQAAQRLLDSGRLEQRELKEILSDIVRDDRRASEVIARIRSMVRKDEVQREPMQINQAVQVVTGLLQGELEAQIVSLSLALAPDLPVVVANQVEIQQVVMNLMLNAIRAVEGLPKEQRRIRVETTHRDRTVKLVVEDSGSGITDDVAVQMFEPFFTTKPTGIGMGLAICQRIVDAHGGRIWVARRDTGCTRMAVQLPLPYEAE